MIMRMNVSNITFHGLIGLEKTICYVHFVWGGGGGTRGDKGWELFQCIIPNVTIFFTQLKGTQTIYN